MHTYMDNRALTWAGPRLQGPGPAHVSALLAIFVYIFYANLRYFVPKDNKNIPNKVPGRMRLK